MVRKQIKIYKSFSLSYCFNFFLLKFYKKQFRKYKYLCLIARSWVVNVGGRSFNQRISATLSGGYSNFFLTYHNSGLFMTWYTKLDFTIFWVFLYVLNVLLGSFKPPFGVWVHDTSCTKLNTLLFFSELKPSLFMYLYKSNVNEVFFIFNSYSYAKYFFERIFSCYHYSEQLLTSSVWYEKLENHFSLQPTNSYFMYYLNLDKTFDDFLHEVNVGSKLNTLVCFLTLGCVYGGAESFLISLPLKNHTLVVVVINHELGYFGN